VNQLDNGDWLVNIVVNKAGHFRARLDLYVQWRITVDQIKVGFLASVERDGALEKELHEKIHAPAVSWGLVWPDEDSNGELDLSFGLDCRQTDRRFTEHSGDTPYDDILAELQMVGLNHYQEADLLDAVEDWQGDLDEFCAILDGILGGDGQAVDP
jgi:hypothetical protein